MAVSLNCFITTPLTITAFVVASLPQTLVLLLSRLGWQGTARDFRVDAMVRFRNQRQDTWRFRGIVRQGKWEACHAGPDTAKKSAENLSGLSYAVTRKHSPRAPPPVRRASPKFAPKSFCGMGAGPSFSVFLERLFPERSPIASW
jgi:hypothetical protein